MAFWSRFLAFMIGLAQVVSLTYTYQGMSTHIESPLAAGAVALLIQGCAFSGLMLFKSLRGHLLSVATPAVVALYLLGAATSVTTMYLAFHGDAAVENAERAVYLVNRAEVAGAISTASESLKSELDGARLTALAAKELMDEEANEGELSGLGPGKEGMYRERKRDHLAANAALKAVEAQQAGARDELERLSNLLREVDSAAATSRDSARYSDANMALESLVSSADASALGRNYESLRGVALGASLAVDPATAVQASIRELASNDVTRRSTARSNLVLGSLIEVAAFLLAIVRALLSSTGVNTISRYAKLAKAGGKALSEVSEEDPGKEELNAIWELNLRKARNAFYGAVVGDSVWAVAARIYKVMVASETDFESCFGVEPLFQRIVVTKGLPQAALLSLQRRRWITAANDDGDGVMILTREGEAVADALVVLFHPLGIVVRWTVALRLLVLAPEEVGQMGA